MNTYFFNNEDYKNTTSYKQFISANPGIGYLKIRASAASGALPISDLTITVSKTIDNNNVIFYEGKTNSSGIIDKIPLPAPEQDPNNLDTPKSTSYDITVSSINETYRVNIYDNIYVVQTINVVPTLNVISGDNRWP